MNKIRFTYKNKKYYLKKVPAIILIILVLFLIGFIPGYMAGTALGNDLTRQIEAINNSKIQIIKGE